jgi:hypothetical protein
MDDTMPVLQTNYTQQVFDALPGQYSTAFEPRRVSAKFARGLLRAGLMAFKVPVTGGAGSRNSIDPGEAFQIPSAPVAATVGGIGTAVSSAAGTKTVGSGVTAGTYAAIQLLPARKLTVVFDSSTDWDATTAVITYVNHLNQTVSENLAIATSTTATTVGYAKSFVSLVIPTQTGSGGTATIGFAALGSLTIADALGVVVRQPMKSMVNPSNLYIGPTSDGITNANTLAHYVDGDTVMHLQEGGIWVYSEETILDRDPVYVRVAAGAGGSLLGAFRNDDDSASCVLVPNARFVRDGLTPGGAAQAHFPSI